MPVVINGTTGITNVNGSAAAPAETGTDTDTGIYYGTNTVGIATNGTAALQIDSSQNVSLTAGLSVVGNNISAVNSMGFRNRIINGDMRIDQRNAGAAVTPTVSAYTLDRWQAIIAQSSKFSVQRSTTVPAGFTNSMLVTSTSAYSVLTGDYFAMYQGIEGFNISDLGWGAAGAQSVTLSFWVRSSLTGTFGGSIKNISTRSYPFTYTISSANTFEYKTITIPGDTSGTWNTDNTVGIYVSFGLGVGSTFSGTAGAWAGSNLVSATGATSVVGTNGATFYITGVQLEAGSVATPFERRDYGRELIMCQRYYAKTYEVGTAPGTNTAEGYFVGGTFAIDATTTWGASWRFPVSMRANPTVTFYTAAGTSGSMNYSYKGFSATGGVVSFGLGETAVGMYHNGTASGLTAGEGVVISGNIVASAEL